MRHPAAPSLLQRDPPAPIDDPKAGLPPVSKLIPTEIQKLVAKKFCIFGNYVISSANYSHNEKGEGAIFLFGRKKNLGKQIRIAVDGSVEHF